MTGTPATSIDSNYGFENLLNFRDVGRTVNEFLGQKLVREGVLFRSARPDDASPKDRTRLREEYGIRTVIDLRTKTEHLNAARKRQADLALLPKPLPGAPLVESNAALAEPVQIPGLRYLSVKLTGRSFERFLLSQLSWLSFFKFLFLFVTGFRMRAIAILGREVMLPRGLVRLGLDTLDHSGPEISEALQSLLEPGALPILIHCTQGKDRTGIIIILCLMILGVPATAIDHDYRLSDEALLPEKEARLKEIREIGLTDDFGDTAPGLIQRTAEHLDSKYGGLDGYLDGVGFDPHKRERLRELLSY